MEALLTNTRLPVLAVPAVAGLKTIPGHPELPAKVTRGVVDHLQLAVAVAGHLKRATQEVRHTEVGALSPLFLVQPLTIAVAVPEPI